MCPLTSWVPCNLDLEEFMVCNLYYISLLNNVFTFYKHLFRKLLIFHSKNEIRAVFNYFLLRFLLIHKTLVYASLIKYVYIILNFQIKKFFLLIFFLFVFQDDEDDPYFVELRGAQDSLPPFSPHPCVIKKVFDVLNKCDDVLKIPNSIKIDDEENE